jgi:chromosome segregation ATPase
VALGNQREAADQEREDAEEVRDKLFAQLEKQLSKEHRDSVDAAIAEVDDELTSLQGDVEALAQEVADAEQGAAEAKEKVAALEAGFQEAQAELQRLPAQISAAQSRVADAKTAAKGAAESGRTSEAFFLARDLARAIDDLKQAADPAKESALLGTLLKLEPELEQARKEAEAKAADLEELKRQRTEVEQRLKTKAEGRDAAVKAKLAAGPKPA